jgi:L-lactate dehydrogenase (cytochrome)
MSAIEQCFCIADLRRVARRRLPRAVFDYLDGGADDEVTLRRNNEGFARYQLVPRVLRDVATVDTSTTVLDKSVALPIIFAPTGIPGIFHHEGERAVVAVADRCNMIYTLSSMATTSIEDVARLSRGIRWFQIYVWRDRELLKDFIERCRAGGYHTLILTVDTAVGGNRQRDLVNGLTMQQNLSWGSRFEALRHPEWLFRYFTHRRPRLANVSQYGVDDKTLFGVMDYIAKQFDPSVTWSDAEWMIQTWKGPFGIKGIACADDARRAVEIGAKVVIISNHGGRQLDQSPALIDVLPEIVAAVQGRAEVILDGGVRRGTDVLKALALGARAVMIGRAFLFGLAAGGEAGVMRAVSLLRAEIERDMKLMGCAKLADLGPHSMRRM